MKVLFSGTNCSKMSLMASCDATPPMKAAVLCNSTPFHRTLRQPKSEKNKLKQSSNVTFHPSTQEQDLVRCLTNSHNTMQGLQLKKNIHQNTPGDELFARQVFQHDSILSCSRQATVRQKELINRLQREVPVNQHGFGRRAWVNFFDLVLVDERRTKRISCEKAFNNQFSKN